MRNELWIGFDYLWHFYIFSLLGSPRIMGKTVYVVTKLTTVGYGAD
jgi:hypothetical protein